MENEISDDRRIATKWSKIYRKSDGLRTRWWQSPLILKHINQRIEGNEATSSNSGLIARAKAMAKDRIPFKHGVSVGCGNGAKEIRLIREGLVRSFTLFDLAEEGLRQARELAAAHNLSDRVKIIHGDAFELTKEASSFDFVHWNNSLHHMLDVEKAVQWSHHVCAKGGMFYMDDFVGPSRFQWSARMMDVASSVRKALPKRYLLRPPPISSGVVHKIYCFIARIFMGVFPFLLNKTTVKRPTIDEMILDDPSEAADSSRIIDSIKKYFPNAEIKLTGGVVYHLALNNILQNFDEKKDKHILELMLLIDDLCAEVGETHYATALAFKD